MTLVTTYEVARAHFGRVTISQPTNPHAQFYLGLSHIRTGDLALGTTALQTALQLDPSLTHIHRHLGKAYIQSERYAEALDQFSLAATAHPAHAETQFYLGFTHYALKDYQQALPILHRAGELDTDIRTKTQFYRAVAFYQLKQDAHARELFQMLYEGPDESLADHAQRYLSAIDQRAAEQRLFQLHGTVSLEYDDNVILEPNETEIADQGDGRFVFNLTGRFLPARGPKWRLGGAYTLFQSAHFSLHEFNVQSHTARLFGRLKLPRATLSMTTDYTYSLLDQDRYSGSFSVQPSVTLQQSDVWLSLVSLRFRYDDFFEDLPPEQDPAVRDRDGWHVQAGWTQYLRFKQKRALAYAGYHFEISEHDGTDWEFRGQRLTVGARLPLWWQLTGHVHGTFRRRLYQHVHSFDADPLSILTAQDTRKRDDSTLTASIQVTRPLNHHLRLSLGYQHTSNLSNVDFFDFRRNIVSLTLSGRY